MIIIQQLSPRYTMTRSTVILQHLCLLFFTFHLISAAITTSDTHISTDRNAKRTIICSYFSANYSSSDIASSQTFIDQYSYLSTSQIEAMLYDGQLFQMKTETILIVAPHLIALGILSIIWLPLCCCCVWPEKHPVCRKCRKPEKQLYGRCELKWPAYTALVLYLAIAVGAILGLIQGPDIIYYFNDIGCKTAAIADDTINGRLSPTVQNRFFVGLTPLSTDLASFNSSFNTIWIQNQYSINKANQVALEQTSFELNLATNYTTYTNPLYSNAFSSDGTNYVDVSSEFKNLFLGPLTATSTVLGAINSVTNNIFTEINAVLDPLKAAYSNLSSTGQSNVEGQMTATISNIALIETSLNSFLDKWADLFTNQNFNDQMILVLKAFYGAFFGLALLGLLAAVILACCSVVRVRLIMYFACSFLFFLAFASFGLTIIMAAAAPSLGQVCSYIDTKLSTGTGTKDMFTKLGFGSLGDLYSNCMSDGTGWVMDQIGPTFNSSFSDLLLITQKVQQFNSLIPSYSTANLNAPFTSGIATVTKVQASQLLDVNSTIALNFLNGVRLVVYPVDVSCSSLNVNGDSWMPSYDLYSCPGGKAQNNPCLDLSSTSICPLGCYQIMNEFQSASGDSSYATTLLARYGSTACNYYNYMVKLQDNWNTPRKASMTVVLNNLNLLQDKITEYDTKFKLTQTNVSSYSTILETNFDGLTNLTAGTFNGLDCRVLGESIMDMRNSICVGMLKSINYNLLCLILISYGTLLAACCTICAGIRHFRHLQKMQVHVGYKGVPVSISDSKINDK